MGVFFGDSPQLIGLSGDLSKRGSYFGVDELASPLLALRDMEGDFRVFVNACRQRGGRLLNGRGDTKKLVCPFHGRNKAPLHHFYSNFRAQLRLGPLSER